MAKANIQRVMQMLDPEECAREYELPNAIARDTFRIERYTVDDFDQLVDIVLAYYVHHFRAVVAPNAEAGVPLTRGLVLRLLDEHYRGGREAAFQAASKGFDGAIPGVLDAIRDSFLKEQEAQYFEYTVMECVDIMDHDDIRTLMEQYLQRYGRHLDGEHMPSAEYLATKYREVIKAHANIVRNVRTRISR